VTSRRIPHVVGASDLVALLAEPEVRVVDVRWRLGDPAAGPALYAAGHVPGAVFADIDTDLASAPGDAGRHPLPSAEAFARVAERLGIGDETRVIAYDDQGGATAARLWFLLRYFGHETGAVLDGGIQAFVALGRTLETETRRPTRLGRPFEPRVERSRVVDRATVLAGIGQESSLLIDARAGERYRGEVEPIDPRAGHIPSAVSLPFAGNLASGHFLSADALKQRFDAAGAATKEATVYCGSGVTACHDLLALALAGYEDARLYAGSWSEWSRDDNAPLAKG